ncbi:MAG: AAA family ATPase [Actinomycetes bacterium]
MKLQRLEFRNFKLLDGVVLEFSDRHDRPLTVIRAANGSGKTSILWGLTWALYGQGALPLASPRLGPSWQAVGAPMVVQVIVNFTHEHLGETAKYTLTRSVEETPISENEVEHKSEILQLTRHAEAGDQILKDADIYLREMFPIRLKDTFLTDGDKVQGFISGSHDRKEQQERVKQATRSVLGLDTLEAVQLDIESVEKKLRKELAAEGGKELEEAEAALAACDAELEQLRTRRNSVELERSRIDDGIRDVETELASLRGIGDIELLNAQLETAKRDAGNVEADMAGLFIQIRGLLKSSELFSWGLAETRLRAGHRVLADLADRGVIPGHSIGVLQDRLELRECICGESLADGTTHREHVMSLLDEQAKISQERERLTATFHRTRSGLSEFDEAKNDGRDFDTVRKQVIDRHVDLSDRLSEVNKRRIDAEAKMEGIDEARIQDLVKRLAQYRQDLLDRVEQLGALDRDIRAKDDERTITEKRFHEAQRKATGIAKAEARYEIATDLRRVLDETIRIVKSNCVDAVSSRMNELFMEIVGSNPDLAGAVFKRVAINESSEIIVESAEGALLNPDFELNGASQRALTLAFIWALMEVASRVAPRVIDTPLGMTSGGVKQRMVNAITLPVEEHGLDYQIVLLLTPAEIRDIEDLLHERAGKSQTLSCSKDYPAELKHDWGVSRPEIRVCRCGHDQSCATCERKVETGASSGGASRD